MVEVAKEDEEWSRGSGSGAPPFEGSKGEVGGVRYAEDEVDEGCEKEVLCFPESNVESVLLYPVEGGRLALGEAEKK